MDKFKDHPGYSRKSEKTQPRVQIHPRADDVPPLHQWQGTLRAGVPRRFYYEMEEYPSFLDKMASPFDKFPMTDAKPPEEVGGRIPLSKEKEVKTPKPHCKACTDFKTWMELTAHPRREISKEEREKKGCPLDSELLGSNTWSFLHTMAAYYPERPSVEQQHNMKSFINLLAQFYPCHICAAHLREDLKKFKPNTTNNSTLSNWFCQLHNRVNQRLGKPIFDCNMVLERWRDGWADNSCE